MNPARIARNNIVIGEADHIWKQPLAVLQWQLAPNGGFHEAVDIRIRSSRFARRHNDVAFAFTFRRPLAAMITGMASAKKSPAVAVARLPVEEFEDMSLVFSAPPHP